MKTLNSLAIALISAALVSSCAPAVGSLTTTDVFEGIEQNGSESVGLDQLQSDTGKMIQRIKINPLCEENVTANSRKIEESTSISFKVVPLLASIELGEMNTEENNKKNASEMVVICAFVTGCTPVFCQ